MEIITVFFSYTLRYSLETKEKQMTPASEIILSNFDTKLPNQHLGQFKKKKRK